MASLSEQQRRFPWLQPRKKQQTRRRVSLSHREVLWWRVFAVKIQSLGSDSQVLFPGFAGPVAAEVLWFCFYSEMSFFFSFSFFCIIWLVGVNCKHILLPSIFFIEFIIFSKIVMWQVFIKWCKQKILHQFFIEFKPGSKKIF